MKRIFQVALVLLALLPISSFAQENTTWTEMKKFHEVMSASFHPTEEGNFAPLKQHADDLLNAAKAWKESEIPANFKKEETEAALKKLVIKCGAVNKAVASNQSNEKLKTLIIEAHDAFHVIVGECQKH